MPLSICNVADFGNIKLPRAVEKKDRGGNPISCVAKGCDN